MTEREIIVALELGSQSVRAIAGQKLDGSTFKVLRIEQTPVVECIRRGTVYNIDKTVTAIRRVVDALQTNLKVNIDKVYVGLQGQSLKTVGNFIRRNFDAPTKIDSAIIDSLHSANESMTYPGMELHCVIDQEYKLGNSETLEPEGIETENVEGRYINVVAREKVKNSIISCVKAAGLEPIDCFVAPLVLAENILPESERRSGCALVDMGADTTTVMVFTKNLLRHLAVIPLGGRNITKDITTLHIEMDEAEALKLRYGRALMPEENDKADTPAVQPSAYCDMEKLRAIIVARCEEILRNVLHQIETSNMDDKLQGGVIFTGGAANMPDICAAFAKLSGKHEYKLRVAKPLIGAAELPQLGSGLVDGNFNSLYALLTKGETDCTAAPAPEPPREPEPEVGELKFSDEESVAETKTPEPEKPKKPSLKQRVNAFLGKLQTIVEEH